MTWAVLVGNTDVMYDLVSISFSPEKEDLVKIFIIDGIDDLDGLDYRQIIEFLLEGLKADEREEAFINVIKGIKESKNEQKESENI